MYTWIGRVLQYLGDGRVLEYNNRCAHQFHKVLQKVISRITNEPELIVVFIDLLLHSFDILADPL